MTTPILKTSVCLVLFASSIQAEGWQTRRIHDKFYAEGASAGDLDSDGHADIIAGPLCFLGPAFTDSINIAEPREFPVDTYSDQFFSHVIDANGDGASDVLVLGFPGKSARLYVNPGPTAMDQPWVMKEIADIVDNESPAIVDLLPGGLPEIVCGRE